MTCLEGAMLENGIFVIVVGLIPSISAIVKSITKKPIKVINSED